MVRRDTALPTPWGSSGERCCGLTRLLEAKGDGERYGVLDVVARGGMCDILAVWDRRMNRRVAVKRSRIHLEGPPFGCLHFSPDGEVAAFAFEMQILSQLHHSSIIPLYDFGIDAQNRLFLVMPMVGKETFTTVIDGLHSGSWSLARALVPLLRVCDALRYAHARGVVHADLKPQNIAVGSAGETYVLDWGLARVLPEEPRELQADVQSTTCFFLDRVRQRHVTGELRARGSPGISGTPPYMPPEYLAEGTVSRGFDVYSFGAILYHLLSGRQPYEAEPKSGVFDAILDHAPQSLEELADPRHFELVRIAERCMARKVSDRYSSMDIVRDDLDEFRQRAYARSPGKLAGVRRWWRRRPPRP